MNRIILVFAIFILSITAVSFADDSQQVITLKDGSQIKGVLSGIDNGIYTVKTPIIGDVHVAASDVASITSGGASAAGNIPLPPVGGSNSVMDQQIAAQQKQLMSNPEAM